MDGSHKAGSNAPKTEARGEQHGRDSVLQIPLTGELRRRD